MTSAPLSAGREVFVRGAGYCLGPQLELGQIICSCPSKWLLGFVTTWSLGSKDGVLRKKPGEAEWLFLFFFFHMAPVFDFLNINLFILIGG